MTTINGIPYVAPDKPMECLWSSKKNVDLQADDPHQHVSLYEKPMILNTVLEQIGDTPMVRLNNIGKLYGLKCELLAKCEFFNAGGSVKDRIGLRMVEDAERAGLIEPGWTIIEPTSGNTGIGLALASAVKGYKCIIVMPEKMSNEKVNVLRALGAQIIRTPTSARFDAPNSHICVAQKLQSQIKNSIILDQYRNPANPLAHYDTTGAEILKQVSNKVDMVVMGVGTGGTITGIGRKIKENVPDCKIIGVDPIGSILAEPESLNQSEVGFYEVEGIGYDFIPTVLDRSVVDTWIKVGDKDSLEMARKLIQLEGILCGGSSGTAVVGAVRMAQSLNENQRCVVVLPDGVRNYMTKFVDDDWMDYRNFDFPNRQPTEKPWYYQQQIKEMLHGVSVTVVSEDEKCRDAIKLMKVHGYDQIPVVKANKPREMLGMITVSDIMAKISADNATLDCPVNKVLLSKYPSLKSNESMEKLVKLLRFNPYVVIVEEFGVDQHHIAALLTHIDILDYLSQFDSA